MSVGIITKVDALFSLKPNAQWTLRGEELEWVDTIQTKPTEQELQNEIVRLQAQYDANEYQRKRAAEYPPIGDQLDALWKGGDAAAEMLTKVQAVKTKYPKPN
jgi:hypothetical protein